MKRCNHEAAAIHTWRDGHVGPVAKQCSTVFGCGARLPLDPAAAADQVEYRAAEIAQDATALGVKCTLDMWHPATFTGPLTSKNERIGWFDHAQGLAPESLNSDPDDSDDAVRAGWLARQIYPVDVPHDAHDIGLDGWDRQLIARVCRDHAIELHCTARGCAAFMLGPLPPEWFADPESGELLCPQHAEAREETHAVERAELEPEADDDLADLADLERPLEEDDAVSPPLDTLGPEIAATLTEPEPTP